MKINKNTTLKEILSKAGSQKIMAKYGVPCLSCPMANYEINELKIGQVAKIYSLDIKGLLKELNNNFKKRKND